MIKQFFLSFIFISLLLSAGCGQQRTQQPAPATQAPVVVVTYDGYAGGGRLLQQSFAQTPQRVLAVSEAVVEDLIFLGVADRIAAVSECYSKSYAPYEEQFAKFTWLTKGTGYPSKEAVLDLKPDLIVSWGSLFGDSALGSAQYWHDKGIHTYVMKNTVPTRATGRRRVEYFVDDLQNLAKIFRVEENNKDKIAQLRQCVKRLQAASDSIHKAQKPTVVTLQYLYGNEYFGRTYTDMTADMIELAGGVSLDDELGGRKSIEYLVKLDPDIIMVIDTANTPVAKKLQALRRHKVLGKLKAVRNNRFFVLEHRAFYCGSLRTVEAVEALAQYIKECR